MSNENTIRFSTDMEKDITRVKKVLSENGLYSQSQWAECMASVYYLQKYILPFGVTDEQACEELRNRKPCFNNNYENMRALKMARELCT